MAKALAATANYITEGDYIVSEVYVRENDENFPDSLTQGLAQLKIKNDELDTVLQSIAIDSATAEKDDGVLFVYFFHPSLTTGITVTVSGLVDQVAASLTVDVITEDAETLFDQNAPHPTTTPRKVESVHRARQPSLREPDYGGTVQDEDIALVLLGVEFTEDDNGPIIVGDGAVTYAGGGNRIIPSIDDATVGVLQSAVDTLPMDVGGRMVIEPQSENLLTNAILDATGDGVPPTGFTVTPDDNTLILDHTVSAEWSGIANSWVLRCRASKPWEGTVRGVEASSGKITINPANDLTFSLYAKAQKRTPNTQVATTQLWIKFYDASDVYLDIETLDYNTDNLLTDDYQLLTQTVLSAAFPGTTAKVEVGVRLESYEQPDDLDFTILLPQVEQLAFVTSRIPTEGTALTRLADDVTLPKDNHIENIGGTFTVTLVPGYDNAPPQDVCFFDTTETGPENGFRATHQNADGKLRFEILDNVGATSLDLLSTNAVNLVAGTEVEIQFIWTETEASIEVNDVEVGSVSQAIDVPDVLTGTLNLGRTLADTSYLIAEVVSFNIWRT
jgi:hypothetical protein